MFLVVFPCNTNTTYNTHHHHRSAHRVVFPCNTNTTYNSFLISGCTTVNYDVYYIRKIASSVARQPLAAHFFCFIQALLFRSITKRSSIVG